MGDFSRSPQAVLRENLAQGYVGVQFQQGVPVLDRDLNLMQDLVAAVTRAVIAHYIGDGTAGRDGFEIVALPAPDDFRIRAGADDGPASYLVEGTHVVIPRPMKYTDQTGVPALHAPPDDTPDPRVDIVYLDVWMAVVDAGTDESLLNPDDFGAETTVRLKPAWAVRVAEGGDPEPLTGHSRTRLARLTRPAGQHLIADPMIEDLRSTRLSMTDLTERIRVLERLAFQPPAIDDHDGFDPKRAAPGQPVRIFGKNFDIGGLRVFFGSSEATQRRALSNAEVEAVVPEGLLPSDVTITLETSQPPAAHSAEPFEVRGRPPLISGFTPQDGAPGTKIVITGDHLDENKEGEPPITVLLHVDPDLAEFAEAPIVEKSNERLTVLVPDGLPPNAYHITITHPWGDQVTTNQTFFLHAGDD